MDADNLPTLPWSAPLCVIGGVLLGVIGFRIAFRLKQQRGLWEVHTAAALLAAVALTLAVLGIPAGLWGPLLILAAVPAGFRAASSTSVARLGRAALAGVRAPRFQAITLAVAGPLLGLWWACQASRLSGSGPEPHFLEALAVRAYTDRGQPVALFARRGQWPPHEEVRQREEEFIRQYDLEHQLIRTAPPAQHYNCHGWLFTAGRYWVHGKDVDRILAQNGYHPVRVPQDDDLAIYRDAAGRVIHSGLVRGASKDGVILVESKWGTLGRYLHPARVRYKDLAAGCSFYHSERNGHRLFVPRESVAPGPGITSSG